MNRKAAVFLRQAALAMFIAAMVVLAVCAVALTAENADGYNKFSQHITLVREGLISGLMLSLCAFLGVEGVNWLIKRFGGLKLNAALCAIWLGAAFVWIFAVQLVQRADAQIVMEAAKQFAADDFSALSPETYRIFTYSTGDYFQSYTYQLRLCFPLEMLARLFPKADLNLLAQCVNAALGVAGAGVLAALAQEILGERRAASAVLLLYVLSIPAFTFTTLVYSINLMILFCGIAVLCFARYVHTGMLKFGIGYAVFTGMAMVGKPNAVIIAAALTICALLHALEHKDFKPVLLAIGAVLLGEGLTMALTARYAAAGNVTFRPNVSMLSRLAMGMQDSMIAPGWYNGYIEQVVIEKLSPDQEKVRALADIQARFQWMRENPGAAIHFYIQKYLTQWIEPAYEGLWIDSVSETMGRWNGLIHVICRDDTAIHAALLAYMNAMQSVVYGLAAAGSLFIWKKKDDMAVAVIPVAILGGMLYHLIFEAKSQYAYPYMVYMLPLAAIGLCRLEEGIKGLWKTKERRR